ncbi:hypothetical protein M3Y95_00269800 [Aphelenchoides besseyi]|nr:hypothetical protein M3Y95_00269800 [Aphelenchoides besseyi]
MLKTRAVERFIGQAVSHGVLGVILFNKEGQIVAQNGHGFNANVYASLISNLWETFDRQGVRDRLREIEVRGEQAFLVAMPVSNMLLAIIADAEAPSALCKQKLNELALHLHEPLGVIA